MEKNYLALAFAFVFTVILASSCGDEDINKRPSSLTVYATIDGDQACVFSGEQIAWFDINTRELRFNKYVKQTIQIPQNVVLQFRKDNIELFNARGIITDIRSETFFDTVLYYDQDKHTYFINDFYPVNAEMRNSPTVEQNLKARQAGWDVFISTLKQEKRLK